jgi:hypothetical protein
MTRRIEIQERDEPRTFIVQWFLDGHRIGILFLTAAVTGEIVTRLFFDSEDPLWAGDPVDVDSIARAIDEEIAAEQRELSEKTAHLISTDNTTK